MISFNRKALNYFITTLLCVFALINTCDAQQSSTSKSSGLGGLFAQKNDKFLDPDQAFQVSAVGTAADKIEVQFVITKGYYLYRKRMSFSTDSTQVKLGEPQLPNGQIKHDEYFGDMEVYHDPVTAVIPVSRAAGGPIKLKLKVKYQGCAEAGLCYNPIDKEFDVDLLASTAASTADPSSSGGGKVSEQDRLALALQGNNMGYALLLFFLAGLGLSLTPCVLPMIPILSGIIVGQGESISRGRSFSLAFTYVQGMALTYAGAGALSALLFRQTPQAFFQQPWIIITMTLLFVALAFAMFGAYTLQLPSFLQTKINDASNKQKTGTYVGTFIMGALSALVVTACVAPAIVAALTVIIQSRQVLRGALALYCAGIGMGIPLLAVGASAGDLLPRAGAWMDSVKHLFGVIFLGVGVYLVSSLLPGAVTMTLWAALAIVSGFWIFSLQVKANQPAPSPIRGAGLMLLVYGILLLIGAASGRTDPLQPLEEMHATANAATGESKSVSVQSLPFKRIKSIADLDREVTAAAAANKPVMLDINAEWCTSCKEMEKYTFPDAQVKAALSNAVLLQADVTDNDADDKAILNRFQIFGPPTIAFFVNGQEKANYRVVGYVKAEEFAAHVNEAFGK